MYTIRKSFAFEASHQLPQMPDGHQCARLHGHSYVVTVELRSELLGAAGFVMDFGDLAPVKDFIDRKLDHRHLPDVAELGGRGEDTTSERMAETLFHRFAFFFDKLYAVEVAETAKTSARYSPFEH